MWWLLAVPLAALALFALRHVLIVTLFAMWAVLR